MDWWREREWRKLNHYYDVELNSYRPENIIIIMNKDKINRMLYHGWYLKYTIKKCIFRNWFVLPEIGIPYQIRF
jgi:hypothetical protein